MTFLVSVLIFVAAIANVENGIHETNNKGCPRVDREADFPVVEKSELDDILNELDHTIARRDNFSRVKERCIEELKTSLYSASDKDIFCRYSRLFEEYKNYRYDSAYFYARKLEKLVEDSCVGGGI